MSVVDSREDLEAARTRLVLMDDEELGRDLGYWALARFDAGVRYEALGEQRAREHHLFAEAEQWVALIAHEMSARRDARIGDRTPAQE
jgi:hypothetical protein